MTLFNRLCIIILGMLLAVCPGWVFAAGDDDVNIVASPNTTTAKTPAKKTASTDDAPVVHKSSHKKKKSSSSSDSSTASTTSSGDKSSAAKTATASSDTPAKKSSAKKDSGSSVGNTGNSAKSNKTADKASTPDTSPAKTTAKTSDTLATKDKPAASAPVPAPDGKVGDSGKTSMTASSAKPATSPATATTSATGSSSAAKPNSTGPTVETGLPVARHSGDNPADLPHVPAPYQTLPLAYQQMMSSSSPPLTGVVPNNRSSSAYGTPSQVPKSNFTFSNYPKRSRNYPWKTNIVTTMFWIGEGGSSISSTTQHSSAWIEDWRSANRGTDTPYDRNGYAPANHAATVNPFYIALPFNDLAYPDKARRWLPAGWRRPDQDGKQVSACKDRWIEIKNSEGRICFAQWEDVGPLRSDHAEYVFGSERPTSAYTHAGLDVSPAVAQYLRIKETAITSWRFVDDEDVPPGVWLKYEEEAVIYNAIHSQRRTGSSALERASEPADDDSAKRGAAEAKG